MTRIVAGLARGRRLVVPAGQATRPTSDRAREAMFNTLATRMQLDGAHVLDLYAGSGALGLEASSRGALQVVLVDQHRLAVQAMRTNVRMLGLAGVKVVASSVQTFLTAEPGCRFDLVMLDPPYALEEATVREQVAALVSRGWLQPGAWLVVERSSRDAPWSWPAGVQAVITRTYGEARLWFGQADWFDQPGNDQPGNGESQ